MPSGKTSIVNTSAGLVIQERPVTATDEKLASMLGRLYERARRDARTFHWYEVYPTMFSVSFTLALTMITTKLENIINPFTGTVCIQGETTGKVVWILAVVLFLLGGVMVLARMSSKINDEHKERDRAVSDCLSQHCGL